MTKSAKENRTEAINTLADLWWKEEVNHLREMYDDSLEPAKEGDKPKCYVGNFQYVRFQTKLDQFRRPDVQSFETFQDLFTFEPIIKKTGKKITIPVRVK